MGKNNKKRKRANHALFHAVKARKNGEDPTTRVPMVSTGAAEAKTDEEIITDEDLTTTIRTLEILVRSSSSDNASQSLFHTKRFKDLRRTLHPLVLEQLQSYDKGIDYRHKVTHALQHGQWSDALAALQACLDFRQIPKQGTVQRWVRDGTANGCGCQMQLLQAILRLSGSNSNVDGGGEGGDGNKHDPGEALAAHMAEKPESKEDVVIMEGWKWWDNIDKNNGNSNNDSKESKEKSHTVKKEEKKTEEKEENPSEKTEKEKDDNATSTTKTKADIQSRIVYRENAADRTPPNHYDLLLHTTEPGSITFDDNDSDHPIAVGMHPIPFLPQPARVLSNVLTPNECQQLRHVMTTLGYRSDHPVAHAQPTGIDSCEWMVDASILQKVFERVKPHLPATLTIGKKNSHNNNGGNVVQLFGINPRWRCFRYGQDCVYRPHLDGSWPLCYLDDEGNYRCTQQQQQGQQQQSTIKSYLTFLIYLNEDFEGGETRFYLPQGVARGVVPKTGSVTVFPQGNLASLIHEGSQVTKGTKYVVRTDVLYRPAAGKSNDDEDDDIDDDRDNNDDDNNDDDKSEANDDDKEERQQK